MRIFSHFNLFIFFKEKESDTQKILKEANQLLRSKFKIEKTTIQVEYFDESMVNCNQCKLPE